MAAVVFAKDIKTWPNISRSKERHVNIKQWFWKSSSSIMLYRFDIDEIFLGITIGPLWPMLSSRPYWELGSFKILQDSCFF